MTEVNQATAQKADVENLLFVGSAEVRQWLTAALFYWRQQGQCEPSNRTDGIHAVATGNDEFTSASEQDIDQLLIQLCEDHDPRNFQQELGAVIEAEVPVVVVEINGGLVQRVRSSVPVDFLVADLDEADDEDLTDFFGEEAVLSLSRLRDQVTGGYDGVDPEFCSKALALYQSTL